MTTLAPPSRSTSQRTQALQLANNIRSVRSRLKARIGTCPELLPVVIRDSPLWISSMKVHELLLATDLELPPASAAADTDPAEDSRLHPSPGGCPAGGRGEGPA